MATAADKLNRKAKPEPTQQVTSIQMNPPVVKVAAPQVKVVIPAINMAAPDMGAINQGISDLARVVSGVTQQNAAILAAIQQQNALLEKSLSTKAPVPQINMPPRPGAYYVELEKDDDGATIGMRIEAETSH